MSRTRVSEVSLTLIIIILLSKLLGFARDMFVAGEFGSGAKTDAYFIAMTASTVFFFFIGIAMNTIIVPIISSVRNKDGNEGVNRYLSKLITITFIFSVALTILCFIFTPEIIRILASGFSGSKFDLTVKLTRIGLPMMVALGLGYILKGYLHVHGNFILPALEGFAVSLPMILYILLLSDKYGITGLMFTVLATGLLKLLIYIPGAFFKGFRLKTCTELFDADIKHTLVLMGPIILGTLSGHINMIVDRTIASRLVEGSITALSFSHKLMSLATEILTLTVVAVVYAAISELQARNEHKEFNKNIKFGMNFVILLGIPASVGLIILGNPIVSLFYERGAFTADDTNAMVSALVFYSIGITSICIADLLTKAMYSMKDTNTPMKIGVGAVGLNIVLNIVLSGPMGHNGLALATSLAAVFTMILLMIFFKRKAVDFDYRDLPVILLKSSVASLAMGTIIWVLKRYAFNLYDGYFMSRLGELALIIAIAVMVYILIAYLLKVEEVRLGFLKILEKFKGN